MVRQTIEQSARRRCDASKTTAGLLAGVITVGRRVSAWTWPHPIYTLNMTHRSNSS